MQIEVGTIVEGVVTGLTNFGAFVSLPDNKSGMVHISEVSTEYVKDIRDHLTENQQVKVKVISISDEGKISLSIRRASEEPRQGQNKPKCGRKPNVWQGQTKPEATEKLSFEDMMAKFKQDSEEKMSALKKSSDSRYSGGSRRGNSNKG